MRSASAGDGIEAHRLQRLHRGQLRLGHADPVVGDHAVPVHLQRVAQQRYSLRKYRAIKVVSWRVNFSPDAPADFAGLLAVSQEICRMRMAEKAPSDAPPYCAVVP